MALPKQVQKQLDEVEELEKQLEAQGEDEVKKKKWIEKVKQQNDRKIRILIRPSGTEPVLRILVEGEDDSVFDDILDQIEKKIKEL